jgi:hypothetical protein
MAARQTTGQVLAEEIFTFNTWLLLVVEKFPRNHKFFLGAWAILKSWRRRRRSKRPLRQSGCGGLARGSG